MSQSPQLWLTLASTAIQLTGLGYGFVNYFPIIDFCGSTNTSGNYPMTKTLLLLSVYGYAPLTVISVIFSWIAYTKDWQSGWAFLWLPLLSVVAFFGVLMVTKNDVSNYVDVQRNARSKLPTQRLPPRLEVGVMPSRQEGVPRPGSGTRGRGVGPMMAESTVLEMPPPLPNADDDALPPYAP